jgi:hypothetical protein
MGQREEIDVDAEPTNIEGGLMVDLTKSFAMTGGVAVAVPVFDLTASDVDFASQLQRALNSHTFQMIPEVQFSGTFSAPDILRPFREGIRSFLQQQAASSSLHVGEVFDNPHSLPGTPLYEGFSHAYNQVRDKEFKLVFHGTPEANTVAICSKRAFGIGPSGTAGMNGAGPRRSGPSRGRADLFPARRGETCIIQVHIYTISIAPRQFRSATTRNRTL